jgi:plasmid stabilization system protein ParE
MEMRIEWSEFAKTQLRDIFNYYNSNVSLRVAQKIVGKIIASTRILSYNPLGAQREWLLEESPREYRRLIAGNYKIIYYVKDDVVRIADIWDTRRNPETLRRRVIKAEA